MSTLTDPVLITKLHTFNKKHVKNQYCFCIAVQDAEGKITFHSRLHQPCWGELRTHYNDIEKPGDLHDPFPEGTPIGIAASFQEKNTSEWHKFITGPQSPWSSLFSNGAVVPSYHNDTITGVIVLDTHIDPTLFVHFLLWSAGCHNFNLFLNMGVDPFTSFLLARFLYINGAYYSIRMISQTEEYKLSPRLNIPRLYTSQPHILTDADFYNRGAYNRKRIQNIFKGNFHLTDQFPQSYSKIQYTEEQVLSEIVPYLQEQYNKPISDQE
jgi:hypothetical protein